MIWILLSLQLLFFSASALVNVTDFTETSITLTWSWKDNHNFTVEYGVLNTLNFSIDVSAWTVTIDHLESGQLYKFKVKGYNISGDVTFTPEAIYQATKPYPVRNVSVSSASETSLYITWQDGDNRDVSYAVIYTDGTTDKPVTQSTNTTYLNLTDLRIGHEYSVNVFSVANDIRSNETQRIIDNTVPLPPDNLSIMSVNETGFYIAWQPNVVGEQDSYEVSYMMAGNGVEMKVDCGQLSTECAILTLTGRPGDSYIISIRSVKGQRFSEPKIMQANTKPASLTELKALNTTTTALEVMWKGTEGSKIDVYQVSITPPDSTQNTQNKTVGEPRSIWFKDLIPGKTYQVTVLSVSGTASSKPLHKVFWTVPLAPVIKAVTTNVSIIVSWELPLGQRDNFSIVAKEDNSGINKSAVALGTDVQSILPGLSPGHNYTITITAMAGNQQSPRSVLSGVTTDPNPVQELRIVATDTDSAVISWNPPSLMSLFDSYKLMMSGITTGVPQFLSPNLTSYNVTGLTAGTHYILRLTTLSGNKESTTSSISLITKPPSVESVKLIPESTTLTVTWVMPPEMSFHFINITLSNSSGIAQSVIRSNSSDVASSETFSNLAPGEMYQLSIITLLSDGVEGQPFLTSVITKPDPIKEIRVKLSEPYYIHLEWELISQAHGYLVMVMDMSQSDVSWRNQTETGYSANITDLLPGHHYMVTVQSFVNFTSGVVYSAEVSKNITTKPLPVVSLELIVSPERITVKWKRNPQPDSRIDEFFYRYKPFLKDPGTAWREMYTFNEQEDILNPFPGEKYIVQVHSKSGDQLSDVKETDVVIAPEPPKSLTLLTTMTTVSSLFLELEVDKNITYSTGWNITYSSAMSPERETTLTDPFTNPIELSSLGSGETFTIQVFSLTFDNIRSLLAVQANGTVKPTLNITFNEDSASNSSFSLRYSENPSTFDLYQFQLNSEPPITKLKTDQRLVKFDYLTAGQLYHIQCWVSSAEVNSLKQDFDFQTIPNRVKTSWDIQSTEIIVSFNKAEGMVDFYNISCHYGEIACGEYSVNASDMTQMVKFVELLPFQDYSFTIHTISGGKSVQENVSYQTTQTAPSEVRMVTGLVVAPNTVVVRWKVPAQSNGEITQYTVKYIGKKIGKLDDVKTTNLSRWELPPTNLTLPGLLAGYEYTFSVQAYTVKYGPAGETSLTVPAYPPPFKESLKTEDILPLLEEPPTSTSVRLKFVNAFSEKGGEVITYTVIVSTDNSTEQKTPLLLPGWLTAKNDPAIKAYQAVGNCSIFFVKNADCHSSTREKRNTGSTEFVYFTVGAEMECEKSQKTYCNGPLKPDTAYYIALRAFTAGGPSDTPYSKKIITAPVEVESNQRAVIGGVVGSLLMLVIIALALFVWRYKRSRPNMYKKEAHEMNEDPHMKRNSSRRNRPSRIVKLIDFPEHVQLMSADSDYRFAEEFEELRDVGRDQSCNAAELPQNRAKNRFTNILPYDHSRVKLLPTDDEEGSDYINANYMPGYHSRREYIVTQGPLPSTRDDFWRMLWEQNVRNIIMLTRCVEKGREKCDHYWPQNGESMFYGDLQVAILNETKFPDWTITEFRVSLGDNGRKVRHFHYTGWPDFGVPERPQTLVKFVKTVQTKLISDGGPQIAHCSAGVGRSGTYIALDRLLQHIQHNDWVDPYSIVNEMRCQRVWMVQTEQQYICIHQCLLSVLQGLDEEPIYCNNAHENIGYEDDEGINVEII